VCTRPHRRSGAVIGPEARPAGAVAEAYLASFVTRDPATIASHVTDDFVNEHHSALGDGCTGRATYEQRLAGFLAMFEGLRYEVVRTIEGGDAAAIEYRLLARHDGHDIDIAGVMLFDIRHGLVSRRVDTWDALTFLRQTGAS
jgi:ketosteroid isomerase-like protein